MLTYRITLTLSTGRTEVFSVSAKSVEQARKFGLSTGQSMLKQRGQHCKITHIDVEEYYDVD